MVRAARDAFDGGADIIQLRDKVSDDRKLFDAACLLAELARRRGRLFIVNDRPDIALLSGASGVQIGQDEIPLAGARRIMGKDRIVGVSTHSVRQALEAQRGGADYIGAGPVFRSATRKRLKPVGVKLLNGLRGRIKIPYFAIGGIGRDNIVAVRAAGCGRIAVISAALSGRDIRGSVKALRKKLS